MESEPTDYFGLLAQALNDKYQVEQVVTEGGGGVVYRARDLVRVHGR